MNRSIIIRLLAFFCAVMVGMIDLSAQELSKEQQQSLVGKWQIRIDGGGEIYSGLFSFKLDGSESNSLRGVFTADGKKTAIRSFHREDGLYVVRLKTRRRGLPVKVMFAFELVENRLVGDVDFDSGTSVRSYEFEATKISSELIREESAVETPQSAKTVQQEEVNKISNTAKIPARKQVAIRKLDFQQGEYEYTGTVDTEIWAIAPSKSLFQQGTMTTDGNNGGGESQVLMRFADVFGKGDRQIPKFSRVASAKLVVVAFDPGSTIYLHRMLVPWDDAATWDGMARGISIDNVEASTVRDGFNFGEINMDKQSIEFDVTATVQKWANGAPNYGWVFTSTGSNGWDFYSSDWIEQDLHPRLEIEFEASADGTDQLVRPSLKEARKP